MNTDETLHIDDAHLGNTLVIYRDLINEIESEPTWIRKGLLSKHYYNSQVVGAKNGIPVIEV